MAIEVELKVSVPDRPSVVGWLAAQAAGEPSTFRDTYYDWPDGSLEREGRKGAAGPDRRPRGRVSGRWSTFKAPMLDSTSTPEYETSVTDAIRASTRSSAASVSPTPSPTRITASTTGSDHSRAHAITATVVDVPELPDDTFLEVEALVGDGDDTSDALAALRSSANGLQRRRPGGRVLHRHGPTPEGVSVALPSAPDTRLTTQHRLPATTITGRRTTKGRAQPASASSPLVRSWSDPASTTLATPSGGCHRDRVELAVARQQAGCHRGRAEDQQCRGGLHDRRGRRRVRDAVGVREIMGHVAPPSRCGHAPGCSQHRRGTQLSTLLG